jgi:hypothetical protein
MISPNPVLFLRPVLLGLLFLSLAALRPAQAQLSRSDSAEIVKTDIVTREAYCKWAKKPPVIDGKLDDPCWQDAAAIEQFASFWTQPKTPRAGTKAYLMWDDKYLYYGATMTDTELRAYGKKNNDTLWDGDVFELFFKPRTDKAPYYEFQANPKALVFEASFKGRGDDSKQAPLGSHAVITLNGTLDKPGDKDTGWTVEASIPWTAFARTGGIPKPGDVWSFALCRYDYGPEGTKPILMSSAPLSKPSFHLTEDYGKLRFDGPKLDAPTKARKRRERDR